MKLSTDQITTLKKLISYKGYPEIDLQYEILDHVACKVEVMLEENPKLSLDDAFRKVHTEFGIFGFLDLAESYKASIRKRYRGYFIEEFIQLFTSYKIIFPLFFGFLIYWISKNDQLFGLDWNVQIWIVAFFFIGLIFSLVQFRKDYKQYKNYVSFTNSFEAYGILNFLLQLNFQGIIHFDKEIPTEFDLSSILYWICLTGTFISFFAIIILPFVLNRATEDTKKLQAIYEG
ncbi:hypothetical protein [Algoriphagus marinus]|uniref:hypothetical protein n=1 Tax=Algoriphagus marinus TaxID=1925762 RepID=UPI00094BAB74|nr:hypothetical protein [Algoriphagus marinus]